MIENTGSFDFKAGTGLIKAGAQLFVGSRDRLMAVALPLPKTDWPEVNWEFAIQGTPTTLVAADDRLFAVTHEGHILCFGKDPVEPVIHPMETLIPTHGEWAKKSLEIMDATKVREGYCICWGVGSGRLLTALARRSKMHIIAVDPDAKKVKAARERLMSANFYGDRVSIIHADPLKVDFPPYLASLMVSENLFEAGVTLNAEFIQKAFSSLRPYGGVACLLIPEAQEKNFQQAVLDAKLSNASIKLSALGLLLSRDGALPGADNWTHEHANAANTRVSNDELVKAPLGMLWFGGPPNEGILPRHGHGPQPQVIDGRLIIEGVDKLRAIDVYTGRLLWETYLHGIGTFFDNLAHQPGANSVGTNYISTHEAIYVAFRNSCLKLDPSNGHKVAEFRMPEVGAKKTTPRWGYINVAGDYLIGGADPLLDSAFDPRRQKDRTTKTIRQRQSLREQAPRSDGSLHR